MRCRLVAALVVLLAVLQGCSTDEPVVAQQVQPLIGKWQLVEPDSTFEATLDLVVDPNNPPVDITPFNATGKLAVNTYKARLFASADGKSSVDRISHTEVGGTTQAMQFEQVYLANLGAVVRYEVTAQQQLRLYHGGTKPGVLVYKKSKVL
ncbi:META domain-containing protein [Spirosoma fluminis]